MRATIQRQNAKLSLAAERLGALQQELDESRALNDAAPLRKENDEVCCKSY
jgi:hypothetical protein